MVAHIAEPRWSDPLAWYFFLGGIAAGAHALAALVAILSGDADRRATRPARYLAFPLVILCGLLLTIGLGRPERSRPRLDGSKTHGPRRMGRPPRSVEPWALVALGALSAGSFLTAVVEDGWVKRGRRRGGGGHDEQIGRHRRWPGTLFAAAGVVAAVHVGSDTRALFVGSKPPAWASTTWLGALFLATAASTGVAALIVLARWGCPDVGDAEVERLERINDGAIVLELAALVAFTLSLQGVSGMAFQRWPGMLIPLFVVPVGLVLPLVLRQIRGVSGALDAALLVLLGGFILRLAVVGIPASLALTHP